MHFFFSQGITLENIFMARQQIRDPLPAKFNRVKLFVTCTSPWCNLITSHLSHPACGRGTNRLGMRLLDHVRACIENFKTTEFVSYMPAKNTHFFLHPSLQIICVWDARTCSCIQLYNAVVLPQFWCMHPKIRQNFPIIQFFVIKINVAYTRLKVVARAMYLYGLVQLTVMTLFSSQQNKACPSHPRLTMKNAKNTWLSAICHSATTAISMMQLYWLVLPQGFKRVRFVKAARLKEYCVPFVSLNMHEVIHKFH